MMSYTMSRQGVSPEDIVKCAVSLDLPAIDWVTTCGRSASELRKLSADHGLKICCYTFFLPGMIEGRPDGMDELKKEIETAVALGAPVVMVPTSPPSGVSDRREVQKRWIDVMSVCAGLCKKAGVIPTVENFPGKLSPVITASDFFLFKKAIPGLKLTFDDGNAFLGEDPVESFRRCAADVVHVHFKDWLVRKEPCLGYWEGNEGVWCQPALIGEGEVPGKACLDALEKAGYSGYVNIEYENNKYPAAEGIARALEFLRS